MHAYAPIPGRETLRLRTGTLALCLSAAIAASNAAASSTSGLASTSKTAAQTAQLWPVRTCNDSGPGSLRDVIATQAQSGDTVDLSQLPMSCGMADSLITLGSEIVVSQDILILRGATEGTVTISGAGNSRVLHHTGNGTLALYMMTVSDGYYRASGHTRGGCIQSDQGDVFLDHVTVTECTVASDDSHANGGGVSAELGNVSLIVSRISGNQALGGGNNAGSGGGIYSGGTTLAKYSSISGNSASSSTNHGFGGGIASDKGVTVFASTIDGNSAAYLGGGIFANGATSVYSSTISGNETAGYVGGLFVNGSLTIANSTAAFNHQKSAADGAGGIMLSGNGSMESSVIANNTAGMAHIPADLFVEGTLMGTDNLVMASNIAAPGVITITDDPKLGPLQFNGGPTRTHALLPGSPAVGMGNADGLPVAFEDIDQRGRGYPRKTGPNASVDIGAVQFDSIFADSFNWAF